MFTPPGHGILVRKRVEPEGTGTISAGTWRQTERSLLGGFTPMRAGLKL